MIEKAPEASSEQGESQESVEGTHEFNPEQQKRAGNIVINRESLAGRLLGRISDVGDKIHERALRRDKRKREIRAKVVRGTRDFMLRPIRTSVGMAYATTKAVIKGGLKVLTFPWKVERAVREGIDKGLTKLADKIEEGPERRIVLAFQDLERANQERTDEVGQEIQKEEEEEIAA